VLLDASLTYRAKDQLRLVRSENGRLRWERACTTILLSCMITEICQKLCTCLLSRSLRITSACILSLIIIHLYYLLVGCSLDVILRTFLLWHSFFIRSWIPTLKVLFTKNSSLPPLFFLLKLLFIIFLNGSFLWCSMYLCTKSFQV
jgi:hypothetical protein